MMQTVDLKHELAVTNSYFAELGATSRFSSGTTLKRPVADLRTVLGATRRFHDGSNRIPYSSLTHWIAEAVRSFSFLRHRDDFNHPNDPSYVYKELSSITQIEGLSS
jgi:hypothetical protein